MKLALLTFEESAAAFKQHPVCLWPVGSTEPHGPHLALCTDVLLAEGMAQRAAVILQERGESVLLLPSLPLGVTEFGRHFAGALSISPDALVAMVVDVARCLKRDGAAALSLINAHLEPGQLAALRHAAHEATAVTGLPVSFMDKTLPSVARTLGAEFKSGACHAGAYETSMVLAQDASAVRIDVMAALPAVDISISKAIVAGQTSFKEAGAHRAYFGAPALSSAVEGEARLMTLARHVVDHLDAMLKKP